jgi:hypothetical protein
MKKNAILRVSAVLFLTAVLVSQSLSCITIKARPDAEQGSPISGSAADSGNYTPAPPAVQGTITTGAPAIADTKTIGSSGGKITISKPGDPLNGLELTVPAKSYNGDKKFEILTADIQGHTFGKYFKPVSPLIRIENGGGYSNELITLKIPVQTAPGIFAMPFLFNSARGEIQGMPIVKQEQGFITVATRHFTDVVIADGAFLDSPDLKDTSWDTGFLPGKDDWEFPNARSYITPDGNCNGMSLAAMWYFIKKPDGSKRLSNAYDNNGNSPATPAFWQDNSLAYRFASVIMDDFFWDAYENKYFRNLEGVNDRTTWRAIVASIMNTGEPQLVAVRQTSSNLGHALVVYSATILGPDEGFLRVSDPNMFGNTERKITYKNGKFENYNTAFVTDGPGYLLDKVLFVGKDTLIDWVDCDARWKEFKAKTIGNNPSTGHPQFPKYTLIYTNSKKEKKDVKEDSAITTNDKQFQITAEKSGSATLGTQIYREGSKMTANKDKYFELLPGKNRLGIYIAGKVNDNFYYVDFKYIDINLCDLTIEPAVLEGEVDQPYAFTAASGSKAAKIRYDWSINDKGAQSGEKTSMKPTFNKAGDFTVKVALIEDDKETCYVTSKVTIKDKKTTTPSTPAEVSSPGGSVSGTFPASPFNGMQVTYAVNGVSITGQKDSEGMEVKRVLQGKMASSGSLSVSGSAKMGNGYSADLVVTVTVDGQSKDFKKNIKSGYPGFNSESFNISVPIPKNAKGGSVTISMTGHYNAGERWVTVTGTF